VVRRINNQTSALGLAHEWRHVFMISKGMSTRSEANFCLCKQSIKELTIGDKIEPLASQMVGLESEHFGVTWFGYLEVLFGTRKC
jgi:hypothetical protein